MAKRKNNKAFKISAIVGGALLLGTLVYVFMFTSLFSGFFKGKADEAISAGKIEISSKRDFNRYFIFLPAEKVSKLLEDAEGKFLFPQIDLGIAEGKNFVVKEQQIQPEGDINPMKLVTISGLPEGTEIYSSAGGLVRGWIVPGEGVSYAWSKEVLLKDDKNGVALVYFPAIDLGTTESNSFAEWVESGAYYPAGLGTPYATISVSETIPEDFIPGGVSIAMAIAKDGESYTDFGLDKILTHEGRIVMVKK